MEAKERNQATYQYKHSSENMKKRDFLQLSTKDQISNLVGDRAQAKNACGDSKHACKMGRAKAPVLPEPVCASPIKSFPKKRNQNRIERFKII